MTVGEIKMRPRLPDWLHTQLPTSDAFAQTRSLLHEFGLHTVCESAKCPNHWECWSKGTATFMIAGDRCTRACGFCAVTTAKPFALDANEPGAWPKPPAGYGCATSSSRPLRAMTSWTAARPILPKPLPSCAN